ncbi:MAG: hypothetical protein K2L54_00555, partial [Clostridiales bacterium]|nr:hypothetical protein [Clostridiales bacterium]
ITVTIDKNWNPISVYSVENYARAIPVLGAMNCTGRLTEVFTQLDDPVGVVPERDFFQPYVDEAKRNPDFNGGGNFPPQEDNSAAAYLAAAFGDYISGAKNLDLTVDMAVGDFTAYDLTLSLNIDTMAVRAMLGNLYVGYSGDKVNIKLNDINGYVSAAEFSELLKNEQIKNLFGGLGEFDVTQLFGGDILGTVFENCEMTTDNGIRRIHMPFAIDTSSFGADGLTSVEVDASIYIKEDGKSLQSITGDISVLGKTINVVAKPLKTAPVFPATDNATDLSGILVFLPDLIATATRPTLDISGQIVAMGQTVNVDAYIDRTNGLKVEAVLSVMGADLSVKYVDGTVYVGLGNIDARGTAEELPTLVNALLDTVDLGKYTDLIRMLMPKSLNDVVSMIKSLDVSENEITLELNFLTSPVTVYAKRGDGIIAGFGMGIDFDMLGIKFDAAADFDVSAPEAREIELPSGDDYISFAQLAQLITDITPYLENSANYDIAFRGNIAQGANVYAVDGEFTIDKLTDNKQVYGVTAAGAAIVLGQTVNIVHIDGVTYIEFAGLRAKLASSDAGKFKSPVLRIINALADAATFDPADIVSGAVEAVKSITVNDDGALVITISVNGDDLTVVFAPKLGTVSVAGVVDGIAVDLEITVGITDAVRDISAPQNASEYMNAAELDVTLEKLADIVEVKAISAPIAVTADGTTYTALFELSFADGLKARLTENTLGLDVTLYGGKIYFALEDIRIVATPDDISPLIAALDGIVPADILQMLESTLNGGINVQAVLRSALAAIGSSKLENGIITVTPVVGATTVEIAIATDLSKITVDASGIFVNLDPQARPVTIPAPIGEYAQAKDVIAAFAPMAPLALGDAIEIGINAEIYGVPVIGFAYVSFAGASLADMQAEINVRVGDLPVIVTVRNATVFIKIGANIRLSEELNEKSIMALVDKLDYAIAGLKQT